jgi:hypothetical protein
MASFTDNPQLLGTFNPYIQQLPVDAMVKVGMYKQEQYNAGIEKIQSNIDKIGGLAIGRDVDKAYLQSKINQLGNNLKGFMASDFSDAQLVNSVNGMTGKLASDPYIQSAVSSTANDKKQMEQMEADRQKGILTPQAEYYYNLKRQKYYDDPSLKTEDGKPINFNGKYTQSWDLDKNIIEAVKAVGDSKMSSDVIFEMDPATGKIAIDANGVPKYSSYATRMIREGKFSENVAAAIEGVLNRPEAKQELTMRGVYNYRGYSSMDDFINAYNTEGSKRIKGIANDIDDLENKLLLTASGKAGDEERMAIQAKINYLNGEIKSIADSTEVKVNDARQFGDIDAYKAAVETLKVRNNYMLSGVTEKIQKQVIENIPYNNHQKKIEADRKWIVDQSNMYINSEELKMKKEKHPYEIDKLKAEIGALNPVLPVDDKNRTVDAALPPNEALVFDTYDRFEENAATLRNDRFNFLLEYSMKLEREKKGDRTKEQIENDLKRYQKQDPNYLMSKYEKAKAIVEKNPSKFSDLNGILAKAYTSERQVQDDAQELATYKRDASANSTEFDPNFLEKLSKENIGTYEIEYDNDGAFYSEFLGVKRKATVTPKDLITMKLGMKNNTAHAFGLFLSDDENIEAERAEKEIITKFGVTPSILYKILSGRGEMTTSVKRIDRNTKKVTTSGVNLHASESPAFGFAKDSKIIDAGIGSKTYKNTMSAMAKAIADKNQDNKNYVYSAYGEDPKASEKEGTDKRIGEVITSLINAGGGGDLTGFSEMYKAGGEVVILKDNKTNPGNPKFFLQIKKPDQTLGNPVEITAADAYRIKPSINVSSEGASRIVKKFKLGDDKTTNSITTNIYDANAYKGAYIGQNTFSEVYNTEKVKGVDVIRSSTPGMYNLCFYVKDNEDNVKPVLFRQDTSSNYPMDISSLDKADAVLQTMSKQDMNTIIKLSE